MQELDPLERIYQGTAGETATITVTPNDTVHMVAYSLNGAAAVQLPAGQQLRFPIPAHLLMTFGFSSPSGTSGSYTVVLESVDQYPNNQSPRIYRQAGAAPKIKSYTFL